MKQPKTMTHCPDDYLEPYRRSLTRHGAERFEVTLWASRGSQQQRFLCLTQMVDLTGKRLLDAGSGRGDLAAYLLERGVAFSRYIGIDGLPEVVRSAGERGLPRCEFVAGDFLKNPALLAHGRPDVIFFSGSLNTMSDRDVMAALESGWQATHQILVFNFLSGRCSADAPPQEDPARRLEPFWLLDWALEQTSQVAFRQDYFRYGHDATIVMRKGK